MNMSLSIRKQQLCYDKYFYTVVVFYIYRSLYHSGMFIPLGAKHHSLKHPHNIFWLLLNTKYIAKILKSNILKISIDSEK